MEGERHSEEEYQVSTFSAPSLAVEEARTPRRSKGRLTPSATECNTDRLLGKVHKKVGEVERELSLDEAKMSQKYSRMIGEAKEYCGRCKKLCIKFLRLYVDCQGVKSGLSVQEGDSEVWKLDEWKQVEEWEKDCKKKQEEIKRLAEEFESVVNELSAHASRIAHCDNEARNCGVVLRQFQGIVDQMGGECEEYSKQLAEGIGLLNYSMMLKKVEQSTFPKASLNASEAVEVMREDHEVILGKEREIAEAVLKHLDMKRGELEEKLSVLHKLKEDSTREVLSLEAEKAKAFFENNAERLKLLKREREDECRRLLEDGQMLEAQIASINERKANATIPPTELSDRESTQEIDRVREQNARSVEVLKKEIAQNEKENQALRQRIDELKQVKDAKAMEREAARSAPERAIPRIDEPKVDREMELEIVAQKIEVMKRKFEVLEESEETLLATRSGLRKGQVENSAKQPKKYFATVDSCSEKLREAKLELERCVQTRKKLEGICMKLGNDFKRAQEKRRDLERLKMIKRCGEAEAQDARQAIAFKRQELINRRKRCMEELPSSLPPPLLLLVIALVVLASMLVFSLL